MILTFNVGSSSLKYALFDEELHVLEENSFPLTKNIGLKILQKLPRPKAIGHRIVHGGNTFKSPVRITNTVLKKLEGLLPFSPIHLPIELDLIKQCTKEKILQIACFDTAFHQAMPLMQQHLPIPLSLWKEGVKKYGFHGLSYEYILHSLGKEIAQKKLIIAHLGSGASMVAIKNGKPIDTTMGLTPTGGIMMGTRTGDLDPGLITYLLREKNYTTKQIDVLTNCQSGLLGVSNITNDMKRLLMLAKTNPNAKMAILLFCYIARKAIGSFTAALGGLDLLIFTGGIGENSKKIRKEICRGLTYLNIEKKVRVIPTQENFMIAKHTKKFITLPKK